MMKKRRLLCTLITLFLCSFTLFGQKNALKGIELSNSVFSFLKKCDFSPSTQSLVVSGENTFPYNIIVTLNPEQDTHTENLLLIFYQEDVANNQENLKKTLNSIRSQQYQFGIKVLFAYGEKQEIVKDDMIYGTRVFLDSLNTNLEYTAVIFDLDAKNNDISVIAGGVSSPHWLIKSSYNLYKSLHIGENLPSFYLSQISSYNFISSRILEGFFEYDIPAIKYSLDSEIKDYEIVEKLITGTVQNFSTTFDTSWDKHFLLMKFFGTYHTISENVILRIVLPTILLWLLFILLLVFVNNRLKKHTWSAIRRIWYCVPATFVIIELAFFITAFIFKNFSYSLSPAGKVYGLITSQIIVSLFFTFIFFLFTLLLNLRFEESSVDYLLVISCFINQSLFILSDISLCPIFIFICTLSLLALGVKKNIVHIIIFYFMIVPLVPYAHNIIKLSDTKLLSQFLLESHSTTFIIPLVLYPYFIMLFRILTSFRTKSKRISTIVISVTATFFIILISLITLSIIRTRQINKTNAATPVQKILPSGDDLIEIKYSDNTIFNDIIRTIDITLDQECVFCDLQITLQNQGQSPVLYSDNDYINSASNTVHFRIPDHPPKNMTFTYGASSYPSKIIAIAVIQDEETGSYNYISKSLQTGEW